jgi:hypothetical protein
MAIAVVLDFKGATTAQYDEVIRQMGFAPGGPGGPGSLFHWATGTEDGLRVVDVWTTREAFESFAAEHIVPITQAVGLAAPDIKFIEAHNYLTAG